MLPTNKRSAAELSLVSLVQPFSCWHRLGFLAAVARSRAVSRCCEDEFVSHCTVLWLSVGRRELLSGQNETLASSGSGTMRGASREA